MDYWRLVHVALHGLGCGILFLFLSQGKQNYVANIRKVQKARGQLIACWLLIDLHAGLLLQMDEPRHDRRLHHQRKWTEVTQYMEAVWRAEAEKQDT